MERVQTRSMFLTDALEGSPGFALRLSGVCVPGCAAERGSSEAGGGGAPAGGGGPPPAGGGGGGPFGRMGKKNNPKFN